jgi:hypothetical protein
MGSFFAKPQWQAETPAWRSANDVLRLAQTIAIWQDQILSDYQAESGGVEPIFVVPVAQVRVASDALKENILLTTVARSGHQTILSLPLPIADHIARVISSRACGYRDIEADETITTK